LLEILQTLLDFVSNPFWFAGFTTFFITRVIADYLKKRVYWKTGDLKVHLHHFLVGFPVIEISIILYNLQIMAPANLLAGISTALWASEAKELILQLWQP
jgi:L-alanine-DL-glutamate epimerase-like enolase superfamily enzyme